MKVYIHFYIPKNKLKNVNDKLKNNFLNYCYKLMPRDAGYEIDGASFESKFIIEDFKSSLEEDTNKIFNGMSQEILSNLLLTNIKVKGKEMA